MQDNDPKHTFLLARSFYVNNNINWWKTPAESPNLNLIKNLWHELKDHIHSQVKPHNKEKLIQGIREPLIQQNALGFYMLTSYAVWYKILMGKN